MDPNYRLRPMDLRDILDETFDLYKNNFLLFFTISAIVFLPFQLIMSFVTGSVATPTGLSSGRFDPAILMSPSVVRWASVLSLTGILTMIASYVSVGALSYAVSERYLGRTVTAQEAYAQITSRLGSFIGTLLLVLVLIGMGQLFIIGVPLLLAGVLFALNPVIGIIAMILALLVVMAASVALWILFAFFVPVFVIEGRAGMEAVKRSVQLFRFDFAKAFFSLLLIYAMVGFISVILLGPIEILVGLLSPKVGSPSPLLLAFHGALSGIVQALVQPIQLIVLLLLYYDIRIRREGFDLEIMANELRGNSTSDANSGAGNYETF